MINKEYITYFIKEYLSIIFYVIVICNIIFRVIQSKRKSRKSRKSRKRKGGNNSKFITGIFKVIWCILTLSLGCDWDWFYNKEVDEFDGFDDFKSLFGTPTLDIHDDKYVSLLTPFR
tara:strand:+ start:236 stop:586 length:351 start_codon:yes stop_codon:yes gene_type:complete